MSLVPVQINSLRRDINEITYAIRRAEKKGDIIKAEDLKAKKMYMIEQVEELKDLHYA